MLLAPAHLFFWFSRDYEEMMQKDVNPVMVISLLFSNIAFVHFGVCSSRGNIY